MISALHFPKFRKREFRIPLIHVVETKLRFYSDGSWTSRTRAEPIITAHGPYIAATLLTSGLGSESQDPASPLLLKGQLSFLSPPLS